jgi:hypothetical protein
LTNFDQVRPAPRRRFASGRLFLGVIAVLGWAAPGRAADSAAAVPTERAAPADESEENDEVISLAAYNVKADRIEDFGLRVEAETYSGKQPNLATIWFSTFAPRIVAIVPNTAAAKAGLRPGERILKSEGQSTVGGLFSTGKFGQWSKTQKKKWAEVAAGKTNVTWTLEVETPGTKAVRTVKLVVPTPPPQWGASTWRPPAGRVATTVREPGPLAEFSRAVLDNGIWTVIDRGQLEALFAMKDPAAAPPTGYEWHLGGKQEARHSMVVTQFRGRTDVIFHVWSRATGVRIFLTSPSGQLEKAWQWRRPKGAMSYALVEDSSAAARGTFAHELDLWTTKVGKVTPRWPFELKPGFDANAYYAALAPAESAAAAVTAASLPADFLKLPAATAAQRDLFTEAYGRLGADADGWAYTETSHSVEDQRVIVARIDPSLPPAMRGTLLSIEGRPPTAAEIEQWHADGSDTPKPLGELPPIAGIVDLKDVRVSQDNAASIVFELPVRSDNASFPADKFQALFRVNKARRSFEEITVKLREAMRVAGVVKVTEAGLAMRFESFDAALAPQAVHLQAGGGIRVLLVNFARSFEANRTDFKRVVPFEEATAPEK